MQAQWPTLNRIALGQIKSDNNNQMIIVTVCFWDTIEPALDDYSKNLILVSLIK